MPGRDGTGPLGLGLGFGCGCRRGRFYDIAPSDLTEKELLSAQKDLLEARLKTINKHLDRTQDNK